MNVEGASNFERLKNNIESASPGSVIIAPEGEFHFESTIYVPSGVQIVGAGIGKTKFILSDWANCHFFTNADHPRGNEDIVFQGFSMIGNMENQERPENHKPLTFACGIYLKHVKNVTVSDISAYGIRQTTAHFSKCQSVRVDRLYSNKVGWSGVSTSGTDKAYFDTVVHDSGLDKMHSAIHIDGGQGVIVKYLISKSTGNGLMLDSAFSSLTDVSCVGSSTDCLRGVSLSGDHTNTLRAVTLKVDSYANRQCGVMISNSSSCHIFDSRIIGNGKYGILFQGRNGGRDCVVSNTEVFGHESDICELHASGNNAIVDPTGWGAAKSNPVLNFETGSPSQAKANSANLRKLCSVCGEEAEFHTLPERALREDYRCSNCSASLRYRVQTKAILKALSSITGHDVVKLPSIKAASAEGYIKDVDIYEPGIVGSFAQFFAAANVFQRSYFWDDIPLGALKDGVRNENLEKLTFPDASFDLVVTSDIFEHIRRPMDAFREVARVLKPGGRHVFTVPAQLPMRKITQYRVDTSGSEDIHLCEPHYHRAGDGGESLVYTEFGQDFWDCVASEVGTHIDIVEYDVSPGEPPECGRAIAFIQEKPLT